MSMLQIQLEVENGQNAHNSIDTQNGNIYWLRNIFGQPFRNQNNVIIDESLIQKRDNVNPDGEQLIYFTNPEQDTTSELRVIIPEVAIGFAINQLNSFKQTLDNVNFSKIVGEETIDDRELNSASIIKAVELIWFNFKSNRIYEDIHYKRVNSNDSNSHHYVNAAYDDYMRFYRLSAEMFTSNVEDPLCYIHPVLFPKIYSEAFLNNQVPKSSLETDIHEDYYNDIIFQFNRLFIKNQNCTLYIYRDPINTIINNTRTIQAVYRQGGLIRASSGF